MPCCNLSRTSFFSSDLNPLVSSGSTSFRRNGPPSRMRYGFTSFFASLLVINLRQRSEDSHGSAWQPTLSDLVSEKFLRSRRASHQGGKISLHCPPPFCASHRRGHPQNAAPSPPTHWGTQQRYEGHTSATI